MWCIEKYQKLLNVENGEFTTDIQEVDYKQIPLLDKASATLLGNRKMGTMVDMVSQFEVDNILSLFLEWCGKKDIKIEKIILEYAPLVKLVAGRLSMYLGYNVVIPGDVTCYVASEIIGESVKLEEVKGVLPANTAVIVNAKEGKYTFEVTEETVTEEVQGDPRPVYRACGEPHGYILYFHPLRLRYALFRGCAA